MLYVSFKNDLFFKKFLFCSNNCRLINVDIDSFPKFYKNEDMQKSGHRHTPVQQYQ